MYGVVNYGMVKRETIPDKVTCDDVGRGADGMIEIQYTIAAVYSGVTVRSSIHR